MKRHLYRIGAIVRNEGPGGLIARAARKITRCLFYTNSAYWFERDLREPVEEPVPGISVDVSFNDAAACMAWMRQLSDGYVYNRREMSLVEAERHWLPVLRHNGEIIGCIKVGFGRVYIADYARVISLAPHTAFIYDTYVLPALRNRQVGSFLIARTLRRLQEAGVRSVSCHIPDWNKASLRAYIRAGFRKTEYVRHFRVFGIFKYESHSPSHQEGQSAQA